MTKPYYDSLPTHFEPTHYDVEVSDIDTDANTFSGRVRIHLTVKAASDEFNFNYRQLQVNKEDIAVEGTEVKTVELTQFESKDFMVAKFDRIIEPAEFPTIIVSIKYKGSIQTNMTGFYRSDYLEGDTDKVMLSTQFEAPDARRAFPCLDEPLLKATFTISLTIPQHWTGLANMPVKDTTESENGLKTITFEETPKVSTYLVAWACGEFEYIETFTEKLYYNDKPLPIRIYTTHGYSKDAEYALSIAPRIIDYFSTIFDLKYPLPKLDLIAVHSYSHNAMENWGLITYRSNALLFDGEKSDTAFKKQVCYVVSHEIAHMWFGDLVTMKWWDELWLNEGFATWVGYVAVDYLEPQWNIFNLVVNDSLQQSLVLDALRSSHPIKVPVVDAVDIDQIFDAISYLKGCSIIMMISTYIGRDIFLQGVAKYLNKSKFGNSTMTDLWNAVEEVSGKPVNKMMNDWVDKIGFPLVNVDLRDGQLILTQSRFLSTADVKEDEDATIWWVPLNISTGPKDEDILDTLAVDSFQSRRIVIDSFPIKDGFFKLNKNSAGFYRVNYSSEIIQKHIIPYFDKLTVKDKIGFVSDINAVAMSGDASTDTLLDILKSLTDSKQLGDDYSFWSSISEIVSRLNIVFSGDKEVLAGLNNLATYIYKDIGEKLLSQVKESELLEKADFGTANLISNVFRTSGLLGVPAFVDYAKTLFKNWKETGTLNPNLVGYVFSTIASLEDLEEDDFNKVFNEILTPLTLDSREHAVKSLPCITNTKYISKLLEAIKDPQVVPLMDCHYMAQLLTKNHILRDQFWTYFRDNYDEFYKNLSTNVSIIERFFRFTFVNYQSEEMYKELESFFKDVTGFERSFGQAVDTVKTNNKWFKRDHASVKAWLKQHEYI